MGDGHLVYNNSKLLNWYCEQQREKWGREENMRDRIAKQKSSANKTIHCAFPGTKGVWCGRVQSGVESALG